MKRTFTFLIAAVLMLMSSAAWGQTTVTTTSFSAISGIVGGDANVSYAAYRGGGTSNPAVNSNAIRLYQNSAGQTGGYVVIGVADGYQITSATIRSTMGTTTGYKLTDTNPENNTPSKNTFNVSNYSLSANTDYTVNNLTTQYIVFACFGTTSSTRLYLSKISITYESIGGSSVATPTFSPDEGTYVDAQNVTISCETEGATIYYTTDGSTPDNTSTQYTTAIPVSTTTTIKAIAYVGETASNIATATYTITTPYTSIPDLFDAATSTSQAVYVTFNNWVISGVKNNNAYITDNIGNGLIIYQSNHGFNTGDVLSGTAACNLVLYNGAAELTGLTSTTDGLTVTAGGSVTPISMSIADLSGVNTGAVITVSPVYYNGTNLTDGTNEIRPYDTFMDLPNWDQTKYYSVTGVYIQYSNTKEIAPRTDDDIVLFENQAAFSIEAPENVVPGDVIDVIIRIAGDFQANTLDYELTYNANAFEYQSRTNGEVITAIQNASDDNVVMFGTNNPGLITCGILATVAPFSDEGILFTVHFKVKEEAELGTYDFVNGIVTFSYYPVSGMTADIPFSVTDASVTVTNVSGSVTLHTNGVVGEPQTVYGSIELPTADDVAGYAFAGWTADENNIQLVANPYTPSGSVNLYAVYSEDSGDYVKVTSNLENFSGEYLIVYEDGSLAFDGSLTTLDASGNSISVTITNGTIASNSTNDAATFTIASINGGYSIKSASGKYVGRTGNSNGLDADDEEAYPNAVTYNVEDGIVDIVSGGAYLRYNATSGQTRFRYFKSSTYTSQKAIQLYKRETPYYTRVFAESEPLTDVTITGPSVIPAGYTLEVTGEMSNTDAAKLVIEDGAQLVHSSADVAATVRKNVTGYGASDGGWHLFASPVDAADATPLKTDPYDLFKYNEPTHYWYNDKVQGHEINTLEKGVGYLYAIPEDQMVQLAGTLVPSGTNYTIEDLSYTTQSPIEGGEGTENNPLPGFNLVGNPFACDAYVDRDYMVLNTAGDGFVNGDGAISPFRGVFVQASATGESVTFSRTPSNTGSKITLNISQTRGEIIDNATVAFGEGSGMYKFYLNSEATRLYIPKGNTDYAVAYAEGENEMPVNFVAAKNGTYTISVVTKDIATDYLHLIDNLTGADVDLLTTPSYTFEARKSDYASRFRLLFSTNGIEEPVAVEHFAYITNGNLVIDDIDGEALVQIIDQTGRILSSERFSGSYSKQVEGSAGLYFVRLITGNTVRTQKIVIE